MLSFFIGFRYVSDSALLRISHEPILIFVPQYMQRHAVAEEGFEIRSQTHRSFLLQGKHQTCIDQTPHVAYAQRNSAAVNELRKVQSS